MATTITGTFETRREAEMVVEHLVQEHDIERGDILIGTEDDENSVGIAVDGADEEDDADEAALAGRILVSVDVADEALVEDIEEVFHEFGAEDVTS